MALFVSKAYFGDSALGVLIETNVFIIIVRVFIVVSIVHTNKAPRPFQFFTNSKIMTTITKRTRTAKYVAHCQKY